MNNPLFMGIHLGGESTSRTSVALFELDQEDNKLKFRSIDEKVGARKFENADGVLKTLIESKGLPVRHKQGNYIYKIAINAPFTLPPCFFCGQNCRGVECLSLKGKYLDKLSKINKKMVSQKKKFLPYIHRPCDAFLRTFVDPSLSHHEPMNANNSHLAARGYYIKEVLLRDYSFIEAYPKLILVMLRKKFKLLKKQVVSYNSISNGKFYRKYMIEKFENEFSVCIPEVEKNKITSSSENFCAFVLGFLSYLQYIDKTEVMPADFPLNANWIYFPKCE